MDTLRFRILYLGRCEHEKYKLVRTEDPDSLIKSPRLAVLIDHPSLGKMLFDTGDSDNWATVNDKEINQLYPTTEHIPLNEALDKCGVSIDEIDRVVLSHLHFDHAGGLSHFAGKKAGKNVIVSREEAASVFFDTIAAPGLLGHAYTPCLYAGIEGMTYTPVEGGVELAEGVTLFVQHSHVKGLLGLILKLNQRDTVLFTSDSVYTRESYEKALPPGGALNVGDDDFLRNLEIIKQMRKDLNATLFFGHDYDQAVRWAAAGWISDLNGLKE